MTALAELQTPTPAFPTGLAERPFMLAGRRMPSRFCLAPLAGYTNWALRLTVRELGGLGLATTDLVNARALLEGSRKTVELTHTSPDDKPLAIQIYGSEEKYVSGAARQLVDAGYEHIDINMGCPVNKITKN